jgi:hypothetical protein
VGNNEFRVQVLKGTDGSMPRFDQTSVMSWG